jgi:hypothetical protein
VKTLLECFDCGAATAKRSAGASLKTLRAALLGCSLLSSPASAQFPLSAAAGRAISKWPRLRIGCMVSPDGCSIPRPSSIDSHNHHCGMLGRAGRQHRAPRLSTIARWRRCEICFAFAESLVESRPFHKSKGSTVFPTGARARLPSSSRWVRDTPPALTSEPAEPREAGQHHRPGRRLGDRSKDCLRHGARSVEKFGGERARRIKEEIVAPAPREGRSLGTRSLGTEGPKRREN